MIPPDPDYRARVERIFAAAPFIAALGVELVDCGPGWCETRLTVEPRHLQQDGYVHAGVQATVADHTAGAAAGTLLRPDQIVLSVEFKVNLLRPAQGIALRCRAEVMRAGRQLVPVSADVWVDDRHTSHLMGTMMLVER